MSLDTVLLRDEFSDNRSAGAVNGTTSDSGHTRKVVDANNLISISGGKLVIAAAPSGTGGDPQLWTPAITRTSGLVAIMSVQRSADAGGVLYFGFSTNNTTWHATANFFHSSGLAIAAREPSKDIGLYSLLSSRKFAIALRSSGACQFIENNGHMLLVWIDNVLNGATNYLSINSTIAGSTSYLDYWRVAGYWLPVPLVSDGFSTNGTSDGLGHAETSGIGSGGSGISWSNVGGGWSVSGGKAINTPSLGSNAVSNGDFASDTVWTKGTNWTISGGVGVATGVVGADIYQAALTLGKWYKLTFTASISVGQMRALLGSLAGASSSGSSFSMTGRATTAFVGIRGQATTTGTIDNVSAKELLLSDLLSLHASSTPDVFVGIDVVVAADTQAGLALNWDSSSNPQNGVIAYHDGANAKLEKCVAGTWTTVVSAAATYSANARLIVSKIGTAYRLYYNNALVGSGTISDAGIINNTLHGRFSTDPSSNLDNYTCYASGTSGEYDSALAIQVSASGASAGAGDSTANATRKRTAGGVSAGVGDATANATRKRTAGGASAGVGSASGTSTARRLASGQSDGTSSATGAISVRRNVSGQSDGTGSASATSSRKRTASGTSAGRGTATVHNYTVSATISS